MMVVTKMSLSQNIYIYIYIHIQYMFRLEVTIIRQTFQYMDITCSLFTVWDPILFTFTV